MADKITIEDKVARVVVSRPMVGLLAMQVCAVDDATDEEILEVANRDNVCGTTNGWVTVIRNQDDYPKESHMGPCDDHPGRTHFLVLC